MRDFWILSVGIVYQQTADVIYAFPRNGAAVVAGQFILPVQLLNVCSR